MTLQQIGRYTRKFAGYWLLFAGLLLICGSWGCSTSSYLEKAEKGWEKSKRKIFRGFRVSGAGLKRKVGIAEFQNRTFFKDSELARQFHESVVHNLSQSCTNLELMLPDAEGYEELLAGMPKFSTGQIDNLQIVSSGRRLGLNAVVGGCVDDIRTKQEERGFWWFKDTQYSIEIILFLQSYDTETGAKLLDQTHIEEIEVDEAEFEEIERHRDVHLGQIKEAIEEAAEDLCAELCMTIRDTSWKAYVLDVDGGVVRISAGSKSGLSSGKALEVYESNRLIHGVNGEKFFVPGGKLADLNITELHEDDALAEIVDGGAVGAGNVVRLQ